MGYNMTYRGSQPTGKNNAKHRLKSENPAGMSKKGNYAMIAATGTAKRKLANEQHRDWMKQHGYEIAVRPQEGELHSYGSKRKHPKC